jgi:hypothetical protein
MPYGWPVGCRVWVATAALTARAVASLSQNRSSHRLSLRPLRSRLRRPDETTSQRRPGRTACEGWSAPLTLALNRRWLSSKMRQYRQSEWPSRHHASPYNCCALAPVRCWLGCHRRGHYQTATQPAAQDLLRAAGLPDSPQLISEPVRWPLLVRGQIDQKAHTRWSMQGILARASGERCLRLPMVDRLCRRFRFTGEADAEDLLTRSYRSKAWALPGRCRAGVAC